MGFRGSRAERVAMTTPKRFWPGLPQPATRSLQPAICLHPARSRPAGARQTHCRRLLCCLSLPLFFSSFHPLHLHGNLSLLVSLENKFIPWVENTFLKKSQHGNYDLVPLMIKWYINPRLRVLSIVEKDLSIFNTFLIFQVEHWLLHHPFCCWR